MNRDRDEVIAAWIEIHKADSNSAVYEEKYWAWERFDDLVSEDPHEALEWIRETMQRDASDTILFNLAAGPLEDLLVRHGPAMVDEIERLARTDPAFNNLLGGVWENSIVPEVWRRVEAVRKTVW